MRTNNALAAIGPAWLSVVAAAVFVLAACQQPQPAATTPKAEAPKAVAPVANPEQAKSFPNCTWGEVKGGGVSIWAFTCPDDKIVFDAALPGFKREMTGPNAASYPIVWLFTKAADAPVDAALPAIRAASKGAETCVLAPLADGAPGAFHLVPTGNAKKRHDDFVAGKLARPTEADAFPCGPLGPSEAGMRIISAVPGAPTLVAAAETGSDIPIYDLKTLRAGPP